MQERHMFICPACENSKWADVYRIKEWRIEECAVCGFARIDPLPGRETRSGFYSQEKVVGNNTKQLKFSQKSSRTMKRFFNRIANRDKSKMFYNKLSGYLPAAAKILDIGCGDGSFLRLAKKRFSCTGIEISEYLADLARIQNGVKIIIGDFQVTDLAYEKFDGITLISLLEHLDDPGGAIKKCFNLLNNGGILLIKTVNYGCLNRVIKKENWTGFRPPDHIVYFTPLSLKRLLKKIGFTRIRISAWSFNDNMYCDAWK
ncbi:MAG: class I SAM-dependent methyltransferase [Candidatus Omnitrophota bacterium]|nr:class I SAM-dependent methyltransferase [Candidatus Omnitrophota bacterium]